jgi:hypothetical protein
MKEIGRSAPAPGIHPSTATRFAVNPSDKRNEIRFPLLFHENFVHL